jgi:hypothetical protein
MSNQQSIQAAYETFLIRARAIANSDDPEDRARDIGAVLTDNVREHNTPIAEGWGMAYLPGGISAAGNPGWWELAFAGSISLLQADPNYLDKDERVKLYKIFSATISAGAMKMIYQNDSAYTQHTTQEQRDMLARLGGPRGFQVLTDEEKTCIR